MRLLARVAWGVLAAWPPLSQAGLSLDEAIVRQRAIDAPALADAPFAPTPLSLDIDRPDGIVAALGGPGNDVPPLLRPVARGDGGLQVRAHNSFADGAIRARIGAVWWPGDDHPASLDESSISAPLGAGRVYASVERRHWGPSWTGSLILDAGARPVPAIGWRKDDAEPSRSPLLSWLGPWGADVFGGELAQRSGPRHAHLLGARVQFMPLAGLELATSRTIQWGGSGRPESLRSLYDALVGHDNAKSASQSGSEPGNQLAGFDARYTLKAGAGRSASVYGQMIGEDEAGGWPSHYLGSAGADAAFAIGGARLRVFIERSNTTMRGAFGAPLLGGAYRHHIYTDGYTQLGDPLGYPAGGDVRMTSAGVFVDHGAWTAALMLHSGSAYPTAQLYPGGGRLSGANAELSWQVNADSRLGLALMRWSDPFATHNRAQLSWQQAFR